MNGEGKLLCGEVIWTESWRIRGDPRMWLPARRLPGSLVSMCTTPDVQEGTWVKQSGDVLAQVEGTQGGSQPRAGTKISGQGCLSGVIGCTLHNSRASHSRTSGFGKLSIRGQIVSISAFVVQMVPVTSTHFCPCHTKATADNVWMNGHGGVPTKLYGHGFWISILKLKQLRYIFFFFFNPWKM